MLLSRTVRIVPLVAERVREFLLRFVRDEERPFLSHVVRLGGGTAVGQLIVMLVTPILTRLYTPYEMGLFSLFLAFIGFVWVGTGLRYEMAVVSADNDQEAGLLTCASILSSVPVAVLFGLALWVMIRLDVVSYGRLPYWSVPLAVFLLIVTQLLTSLRYWHVRRSEFSTIGKVLIAQGIGRAVVPVMAGVASLGWIGLLLGETAGRLLGVHRMLTGVCLPFSAIARGGGRSLHQVCRKYWKFPLVSLPSSLLDGLALAIPFPIISRLFGIEKAGLFFLVMRLGTLPASFISASVSDVFHARVSNEYRANADGVRHIVIDTSKTLLRIGLLAYTPVVFLSPLLFGWAFGRPWAPAGWTMTILAPLALASLVVSPLSRLLLVANRQGIKLIVDVLFLCLPAAGMVICRHCLYGGFEISLLVYVLISVVLYGLYFAIIVSVS